MMLNDGTSSAGHLEAFTAVGDGRGPVVKGLLRVTGPASTRPVQPLFQGLSY